MNPFRFPINSLFGGGSFQFDPMNLILEASDKKGALYLGNYEAASDVALLRKHGIKAVLTVAADLRLNYSQSEGIVHEVIPAFDTVGYDLSKHFGRCLDFIEKSLEETSVLVHCLAGISRSATITIAYLMRTKKMGFDQAFSFVKKKRKIIFPNPGFVRQLRVFADQLKIKPFGETNRSRSKAKIPDEIQSNLRSLSLNNFQKKNMNQEPNNFKTPQKNYNYYNVNFTINNKEKNISGVKPINNTPQMKKPNNNFNYAKNPYVQNLTKSNKKDPITKSSEKLFSNNFMTPSPAKNSGNKNRELENYIFLKNKKY